MTSAMKSENFLDPLGVERRRPPWEGINDERTPGRWRKIAGAASRRQHNFVKLTEAMFTNLLSSVSAAVAGDPISGLDAPLDVRWRGPRGAFSFFVMIGPIGEDPPKGFRCRGSGGDDVMWSIVGVT